MTDKLSTSLSATTQRSKYILILLIDADRRDLDPQDILSRVRSAWECQSVIIIKKKSDSGGFHFLIGLHILNASKHILKKQMKNLFSEFPEKECQIQSVKGAGTWSRNLTSKINNKPVLVFGKSTMQELIQLARASQQKKKAQILAPKKRIVWLRTFLKGSYCILKRWTFLMVEQVIRSLMKGFIAIIFYIYFF